MAGCVAAVVVVVDGERGDVTRGAGDTGRTSEGEYGGESLPGDRLYRSER